MKPKYIAEKLVNEYRILLMSEDTDCGNEILCTLIAKKSALICVENIIKSVPLEPIFYDESRFFWQEVKTEIEKL